MKKRTVVALVFVLVLAGMVTWLAGCAGVQTGQSVCDTVPEGSYSAICQAADVMGTRPEDVATILKLANVAALAGNVYTALQADAFIDEVRAYLVQTRDQGGITYADAVNAALARYGLLPPEVQAVFIVLDGAVSIDAPEVTALTLSNYDYDMLLGHMDQQKALLAPFLAVTK